jgi:hypothetical protein
VANGGVTIDPRHPLSFAKTASAFTGETIRAPPRHHLRSRPDGAPEGVRAVLEAEHSLRASGDVERGALTTINYEFGACREADAGLIRIGIHPKRRDAMLVKGSILLTESEGDLARMEGFPIKRPSFWTREVHVVRSYERIGGVRVPVLTKSTARVLIGGRSTFAMTYEYASINGSPVSPRTD